MILTKYNGYIWLSATDTKQLASLLDGAGIKTICEPLLKVNFNEEPIKMKPRSVIVFTSKNAVKAYALSSKKQNLKNRFSPTVFAIGAATAQMAQQVGFENIRASEKDIQSLATLINNSSQHFDNVYYPRAKNVSCHMAKILKLPTNSQVLYHCEQVLKLSDFVLSCLQNKKVFAVVLMSSNTADAFVKIIKKYKLDNQLKNMIVFAISSKVAKKVQDLGCPVRVSNNICGSTKDDRAISYSEKMFYCILKYICLQTSEKT